MPYQIAYRTEGRPCTFTQLYAVASALWKRAQSNFDAPITGPVSR